MLPESVAVGRRSADMIPLTLTHHHARSNTTSLNLYRHPQPSRESLPIFVRKLKINDRAIHASL